MKSWRRRTNRHYKSSKSSVAFRLTELKIRQDVKNTSWCQKVCREKYVKICQNMSGFQKCQDVKKCVVTSKTHHVKNRSRHKNKRTLGLTAPRSNIIHCLWYTIQKTLNDLDMTFQWHTRSHVTGWTERPYMIYYNMICASCKIW